MEKSDEIYKGPQICAGYVGPDAPNRAVQPLGRRNFGIKTMLEKREERSKEGTPPTKGTR